MVEVTCLIIPVLIQLKHFWRINEAAGGRYVVATLANLAAEWFVSKWKIASESVELFTQVLSASVNQMTDGQSFFYSAQCILVLKQH